MERYRPKRVIIEQDVAALPLTQTMLQRLEAIPREFVTTLKPHAEETAGNGWQDAQDTLLLSKNKGRFFEPCPCTKHYLCCSYYILNLCRQLPHDKEEMIMRDIEADFMSDDPIVKRALEGLQTLYDTPTWRALQGYLDNA